MYIKFKKLLMIVAGFFLCLILVPRAQHQSPPTKLSTFIVYKLPVLSITLIHDLLIKKTPLNLPTGIAIFIFFVYQEPIDCGEKTTDSILVGSSPKGRVQIIHLTLDFKVQT